MPGDETRRLLPGDDEIKVRLYGQGLGDCFLLAFPRRGDTNHQDPCYMVIDCGAALSTPERGPRARRVVEDIHAATGGHVHVLVVTHQHFDHISGFQDAWQDWKRMQVDALYLPWTEATAAAGEHKTVGQLRQVLEKAAKKAIEKAAQEGTLDLDPGLRAEADFLGADLHAGAGVLGAAPSMDETMELIRSLCPPDQVRYFEPGDVFQVPGTDCHGYVLGPPLPDKTRQGKKLVELLVDEDDEVMYSYRQLGMPIDEGRPGSSHSFALGDDQSLPALAAGVFALDSIDRSADEGFCPFGARVRLSWDSAMASGFFQQHYGDTERGVNGAWRRIDEDWLGGAGALALRASGFTNNLSLVLAFDVPNSRKMLLFPGDAQVGNWLSWHTIDSWRLRDGAGPAGPPTKQDGKTLMENLLGRVSFYKVGHHGSHNATVRMQGLEAMTHPDLVAYVPVSIPVAQDLMGYCPMPFYPVLHALHRKTAGRVFLSNGRAARLGPEDAAAEQALREQAGIVLSTERMDPIRADGRTVEEAYPLYLEMTVRE